MSYRQEVDTLARHLGAVLARRDPLTGMDLEAGVAGFMATTQLLRTVHAGLVGTGPRGPRDLAALEREPLPLLGRLLRDLPALPQAAMTDVQSSAATTRTGEHWRVVARSATLAQHYWTTALPPSRPTGAAAMSELVVTARTAEALAVAGPVLARALHAAGRDDQAAQLLATTTTGLRSAAVLARHAAAAHAAPYVVGLIQPRPRLVLIVHRASHLPEAVRRLAGMVRDAGHLTPQHAQLVARVGAEAADAAATVLRREGHADVATVLDRHAGLLAGAATTGRRVATITPPDARPLAQAQQIHQFLVQPNAVPAIGARDAWQMGQGIASATTALADVASREVIRRAWLVPSEKSGPSDPVWLPVAPGQPMPTLTDRLDQAAAHAPQLKAALTISPSPAVEAASPARSQGRTATARQPLPPALHATANTAMPRRTPGPAPGRGRG